METRHSGMIENQCGFDNNDEFYFLCLSALITDIRGHDGDDLLHVLWL